jgi:hypothetical protein
VCMLTADRYAKEQQQQEQHPKQQQQPNQPMLLRLSEHQLAKMPLQHKRCSSCTIGWGVAIAYKLGERQPKWDARTAQLTILHLSRS